MKCLIFFLILTSLLLSGIAYSDTDNNTNAANPTNDQSTVGRGRRSGKHSDLNNSSPHKNSGKVQGHCTVVEGPGNPFSGPCVNSVLVLNDADGHELDRERTTPNGDFEFNPIPKGKFTVNTGSQFYELVSPKGLLQGSGQRINLSLRQKP